ncbi:hypothetical protein Pint_07400 [Pistacia integerrima]|uniref:Uncharacterized protein n=1 Tax=Pistacia integerrima TaxID=434235 RepID=A0ACC0XWW2_9ROSI|nr:hypothetical protein Pint_07400 [Pistacia integerrima]
MLGSFCFLKFHSPQHDGKGIHYLIQGLCYRKRNQVLEFRLYIYREQQIIGSNKGIVLCQSSRFNHLSDLPLEVSYGSTTEDCLNKLVAKFPSLEEIRGCMVLALNEEYANDPIIAKDKDELAIIPPLSGG